MIPVFDAEAVLAAVSPADANAIVREAFERHARGEWEMPAKVYVDAGPEAVEASGAPGDFRAMPARGGGLATLKWVTSFPGNSARGLPVVTGALLVSSAATGELVAILECASVTSLRTGAAAAVSATALAPEGAKTVGVIGCGVNGVFAARALAAAGYGPGVCCDVRAESAEALAAELGWATGDRAEAAAQDVVVTVTPGDEPVILASDLRPGQHIAVLGADAAGKAETEPAALAAVPPLLRRVAPGLDRRRAVGRRQGWGDHRGRRHRDRAGPARRGARPRRRRRDHAVRLDRARDPGPGDRARGARCAR